MIQSRQIRMAASPQPVTAPAYQSTSEFPSVGIFARHGSGDGKRKSQSKLMNWLGTLMFSALMLFPFVARFLPIGIRQYLSASLR